MALIEHSGAIGEVFNLGSQEEISIEDLAKKVIQMTGSVSKITYIPYHQAYEEGFEDMDRRMPDITKAKRLIRFTPTRNLEGILKEVIEFYRGKRIGCF